MKKRLRKKKHLGEFAIFGVPFAISLVEEANFESFVDAFISDAIEANGCYVAGGGKKDRFSGFIELGRESDLPEERLKRIAGWLDANSDVDSHVIGKAIDAWYGPFDELDSIDEKI